MRDEATGLKAKVMMFLFLFFVVVRLLDWMFDNDVPGLSRLAVGSLTICTKVK